MSTVFFIKFKFIEVDFFLERHYYLVSRTEEVNYYKFALRDEQNNMFFNMIFVQFCFVHVLSIPIVYKEYFY